MTDSGIAIERSDQTSFKNIGMIARSLPCVMILIAVWLCCAHRCLAASPVLDAVYPRGAQAGTQCEFSLSGARLSDAQEILLYAPGISVEKLDVISNEKLKATVNIAADCRLGEHHMRVRTATGVSDLRTFYVGPFESVEEVEPNNDFSKPQSIKMNVTINGTVQNEDVDHFVVEAKKGDRLSVELEGIRLGLTLFDAYVAILNSDRFELVACDDSSLALQDPVAAVIAPENGQYIIQVREASYGGNSSCHYRLHVGSFPRPTGIYPSGGKVGEKIEVTFLGDVAGEIRQELQLPASGDEYYPLHAEQDSLPAPSANPFRLSAFGNVLEVEPNNNAANATVAEPGLPVAMNGIISEIGDVDHFRFSAKKGEVYDVHVYARRLRSPLDSVLTILNAGNKTLSSNDDAVGPDSHIRFTVPGDGEYVVRITDQLGNGSGDYVYRVEMTPPKPALSLRIPVPGRNTQERMTIPVPRGNRYATLLRAERKDLSGAVDIKTPELPAGMEMRAAEMPASLDVAAIVFQAEADAPLAGKLIEVTGTAGTVTGESRQRIVMVEGLPNNAVYYSTEVNSLAFAVTEPVPFRIRLVPPKVPIVKNGTMNLRIVAERDEGFDQPITCSLPFRPSGVNAASSVTIPKGATEVDYPINANSGATLGEFKIIALGMSDTGAGPVWVSSELTDLEVISQMITMNIQMAATERGKPVDIICDVQHHAPYAGNAKVKLIGLPHKASAQEQTLASGQEELIIPIHTETDSPLGKHSGLFCQVAVYRDGESILHSVGVGGVLRIDPPPQKDESPAKEVVKKEVPAKKPQKRLSRLELLRQQQAER